MVIGYINGMEIYYRTLCGKGAPLGGYFVTILHCVLVSYTYILNFYHNKSEGWGKKFKLHSKQSFSLIYDKIHPTVLLILAFLIHFRL